MKKNLYVLDAIIPLHILGGMEEANLYRNCICEKLVIDKDNVIYKDLRNDKIYYITDKIGFCRVKFGSVRPLSMYYNFLGMPKRVYDKIDGKKVRSKVRSLKKEKKI